MKKVLILGAGMVAKPIVRYLLEKKIHVTVATAPDTMDRAKKMTEGQENGDAIEWVMDDTEALDSMIASHDIVVSLLPWVFHVTVAHHCIYHKKDMVTTSYVKPDMKALDQEVRDAGIIILNELGLDPGIDHMSAMRIIDHVHDKGGNVEAFYSICGALPAPEAADNPFRYKFSWSPKGVLLASNNEALYLHNGKEVAIPGEDIFKNTFKLHFPDVGKLEVYPNRNSMPYIDLYGIPEAKTMMRGTFRYPGWCETLDGMKALKLITNNTYDMTGMTYAEMLAMLIGAEDAENIKQKVASYLSIPEDAHSIKAMEWLGLFSDTRMKRRQDTPFEIVSDLMMEKMTLKPEERDMVAMQHKLLAAYPDNSKEVIRSCMLDFGSQDGDTAIARTVTLPAAIAVEMILKGEITEKGVRIPVTPGIYNPILNALEDMDIKMDECFGLPESEILS
ncbi:MAG: saccharopine dehydrogenase C-terminal domain-containing protein [Bacteroidales bacterium]